MAAEDTNNPTTQIFVLVQFLIKIFDVWDHHRNTIIKNQETKIGEHEETIKKGQEKYNTLEEGKNKNDALLGEVDNAIQDLKKNMEPLVKYFGEEHAKTIGEIRALNGAVSLYIDKKGNLTKEGEKKYNELMERKGWNKEKIMELIDENKYKELIKSSLKNYGEIAKDEKMVGDNGMLNKDGFRAFTNKFFEDFAGDKIKEYMFGNKIENSMVKSKEQDDKNPEKKRNNHEK